MKEALLFKQCKMMQEKSLSIKSNQSNDDEKSLIDILSLGVTTTTTAAQTNSIDFRSIQMNQINNSTLCIKEKDSCNKIHSK